MNNQQNKVREQKGDKKGAKSGASSGTKQKEFTKYNQFKKRDNYIVDHGECCDDPS